MGILNSIIDIISNKATVIYKQQLTPKTWHIKLKVNGADFKNYIPGEHLRVLVGRHNNANLSDMVRTYSVWNYDELQQTADLAVCTFSDGWGAQWANKVAVGDPVLYSGPKGKFTIDNSAQNYLLLGDVSALSHLYELRRHAGINKNVTGIIYADSKDFIFPDLSNSTPFGYLKNEENILETVITEVVWNNIPKENTLVYIAGETAFCTGMNNYFRKVQEWPSKQIKTKPFWHPDKKGLE
ncbi:siderophore-interacting protein [Flavobacterium zepuense]|uniref:Siderophore-interacting protein n=1 Tax=Flavobacterium zepuense TaxID=2593302 RepID=A0A552V2F8_9FLAO|nr:siderophore-interacting protein [Flavobacterium zepuense]TRW24662.1 siderophore-interacting protein [Flavobacterium zepuense]